MSFPRRNTRKITVDGVVYQWHLNSDFEIHNAWIIIGQKGQTGQLVFLDPYHHDFMIGPRAVAEAIRFARAHGWQATVPGKEMRLGSDGDKFAILPDDWVRTFKYY
jgi:hypothetical protein